MPAAFFITPALTRTASEASERIPPTTGITDDMVNFVGKRIMKITVERFSDTHETCQSFGRVRPKGGDYFKTITIKMSNGKEFYICGEDALFDGYMNVWE